jgi:ribosome maturation factor RimP
MSKNGANGKMASGGPMTSSADTTIELEPFVLPLDAAAEEIRSVIEPVVANEQCDLVQIHVARGPRKTTLRIFIDTLDPASSIGMEHLTNFNHLIGDLLEVEDKERGLFRGAWDLEVSSPGLNRTLRKKSHFARAVGQQVKIRSCVKIGAGRNMTGCLTETNDDGIVLRQDEKNQDQSVPWTNIEDAQIIFEFEQPQKKRNNKKQSAVSGKGKQKSSKKNENV